MQGLDVSERMGFFGQLPEDVSSDEYCLVVDAVSTSVKSHKHFGMFGLGAGTDGVVRGYAWDHGFGIVAIA